VFVDRSGRRQRLVLVSGAAAGVLLVAALAMLVAGLVGASPIPLPGLARPAVSTSARTSPSAHTSTTTSARAGSVTPTATTVASPTTGNSGHHGPTQTPSHGGGKPTKS
jgi:hypothetical protein